MTDSKRLYRSEEDRFLGGVCGGIAEVYDLDPTAVRLATVLLEILTAGSAILVYLIAWLIMPSESEVKNRKSVKDVEAEKVEEENAEEE